MAQNAVLLLASLAAMASATAAAGAVPWVNQELERSAPPLDLLVCQAAREHALTLQRRRAFEYHMDDEVVRIDGSGRVTGRELRTRYVHRSRPHGVPVNQTVARDDAGFTEAERVDAERRARERLDRLRTDATELARSVAREEAKIADRGNDLYFAPGSLRLRLEGVDDVGGKPCWVISYRPEPGYRGPKLGFLMRSTGVLWIAMDRPAPLRVELDFIDGMSVAAGPLATLGPGSHLRSTLVEVEPGVLLLDTVDFELRLKILFVAGRRERRITRYRDFTRVLPAWPEYSP